MARLGMALEDGRNAHLLETVRAICTSPLVHEYVIGLTAQPTQRAKAYREAVLLLYPHFVVLKSGLMRDDAKLLEADLQHAILTVPICQRKYHPDRVGASYRGSVGGSSRYDGPDYSVYMSWK